MYVTNTKLMLLEVEECYRNQGYLTHEYHVGFRDIKYPGSMLGDI